MRLQGQLDMRAGGGLGALIGMKDNCPRAGWGQPNAARAVRERRKARIVCRRIGRVEMARVGHGRA